MHCQTSVVELEIWCGSGTEFSHIDCFSARGGGEGRFQLCMISGVGFGLRGGFFSVGGSLLVEGIVGWRVWGSRATGLIVAFGWGLVWR